MTLLAKGEVGGLTAKSVQPETDQKFYVGAAWEGDVDLDLVAVPVRGGTIDTNDVVYFNRKSIFGGAITHSGDALTGIAADDDESIVFNVSKFPPEVTSVVVGIISYSAKDMSEATDTKFSVRDGSAYDAPKLFDMPIGANDIEGETVLVGSVLVRDGSKWNLKNVSEYHTEFDNGMAALQGLVNVANRYAS